MSTDSIEFTGALGGGSFKEHFEGVLSKVAVAVINHGGEKLGGSIKIDLAFTRKSETDQVQALFKLSHTIPTFNGKRAQEIKGGSLFYVDADGCFKESKPISTYAGGMTDE